MVKVQTLPPSAYFYLFSINFILLVISFGLKNSRICTYFNKWHSYGTFVYNQRLSTEIKIPCMHWHTRILGYGLYWDRTSDLFVGKEQVRQKMVGMIGKQSMMVLLN